jgi:CHAT domain-containing protein
MNRKNSQCGGQSRITSCVFSLLIAALLLSQLPTTVGARRGVSLDGQSTPQQVSPADATPAGQDVHTLEQGERVEREIIKGQKHDYLLTLPSGQYVAVIFEQRGVDVLVTLFGPDGKEIDMVDSGTGPQGPEIVWWLTETPGTYRLEVRPSENYMWDSLLQDKSRKALNLNYEARIAEVRPANERDAKRFLAQKTYREAYRLEIDRTEDGARKMLAKFLEAASLFRAAGDDKGEGKALNRSGRACNYLGEFQKAIEYLNRSLLVRRRAGDRVGEAGSLINLGIAYSYLGEPQKALDHYYQSLAIYREVGVRNMEAGALNNIGIVYNDLGDHERAIDSLNQALLIIRGQGERNGEAMMLLNIGVNYRSLGDKQKALSYLNEALRIYQSAGSLVGEASTFIYIGIVYDDLGEPRKAIEYFNGALSYFHASGERASEAAILSALGNAHSDIGEPQKALARLDEALSLWRAVGNRNGEAATLYRLAHHHRKQSETAAARRHIEAALEIIESIRGKIGGKELRASYFATVQDHYELYIDLLMQLHRQSPAGEYAAAALQVSERSRARSLLELLAESGANIRQGVDPALLERERTLGRLLNTKAARRTQLLSATDTTTEQAAVLNKEIAAITAEYQRVRAQIRVQSPRYAALTQPQPLGLREIQNQVLDSETMLLEYTLGEERSYLWVVTTTSFTSFELPKRAVIETAARRVYELLTARTRRVEGESPESRRARVEESDAAYPAAAAALSRMLLGPAAAQLSSKRLVIVGDGALQFIPFAALPKPSATAGAGANPPLVVEHEIVSLPSASTLAVLRRGVEERRSPKKIIAVLADPVFDIDDERIKGINLSKNKGELLSSHDEASRPRTDVERAMEDTGETGSPQRLPRLHGTRWEADQISSLVPRKGMMRALDFAANRATATSGELAQYRIVHFATHAFINAVHPELSGIVLSLVDERGRPQDGFLRAHEIFNLKFSADLIVLSGCRTGLGKEVRGEGLIGLTRGLMYAGSPRVVVSLWSLSDKPAAELIVRFYKKMLGAERLPPAAALRSAQIEMWKNERWGHAYFWAAFVLQGDWR